MAGNNLVKRPVNFPAFTTNQIRVNITAALASYARLTEIEAWTRTGRAAAAGDDAVEFAQSFEAQPNRDIHRHGDRQQSDRPLLPSPRGGSAISGCAAVALTGSGNVEDGAMHDELRCHDVTFSIGASYGADGSARPPPRPRCPRSLSPSISCKPAAGAVANRHGWTAATHTNSSRMNTRHSRLRQGSLLQRVCVGSPMNSAEHREVL